jgi:hypothetical protein
MKNAKNEQIAVLRSFQIYAFIFLITLLTKRPVIIGDLPSDGM